MKINKGAILTDDILLVNFNVGDFGFGSYGFLLLVEIDDYFRFEIVIV